MRGRGSGEIRVKRWSDSGQVIHGKLLLLSLFVIILFVILALNAFRLRQNYSKQSWQGCEWMPGKVTNEKYTKI